MYKAQPFIRIENLSHVYRPEGAPPVHALQDINLEVQRGECVALLGANGSGKTTLARHLNALLLPTEGSVWIDGLDTRDRRHHQTIRARLGMVFQIPADQIVATVVAEDVAFGPENLGVPQPELGDRVEEALRRVGMWEERDRPPHMLSPGQQQRVAIAGALAMRPQGMVFDEATAMLDPQGRKAFWTIVDKLRSDGLTVIYVTHDMDEATRADRVLALQQGQLMLDGPPGQALVDAEYLATLGLALPTVPALVRRLRRQRPALPMSVLTAQELAAALKEAQRA